MWRIAGLYPGEAKTDARDSFMIAVLGQIPPLRPGPLPVRDPVDHVPVIPPAATTPVADR